MKDSSMKVTLPWATNGIPVGEPHDLPDEEAQSLIRRGLATEVKTSKRRSKKKSTKSRDETPDDAEMADEPKPSTEDNDPKEG